MAKYYIFRHGETFATKARVAYGLKLYSAPILEEGKPAIKKMAKFLKDIPSDFNVSSPLKRCRQTVEIINGITGKGFVFDKRLTESFLESYWHLKNRVKSLIDYIEREDYKVVMVCTHGSVISMFKKQLTKGSTEKYSIFEYPDPGVLTVIDDKKVSEISFNE